MLSGNLLLSTTSTRWVTFNMALFVYIERPPFAAVWEYRGKAFSSGMDPEEYTIPNFLRPYTLSEGGPEGVTFPMSRGKDLNSAASPLIE